MDEYTLSNWQKKKQCHRGSWESRRYYPDMAWVPFVVCRITYISYSWLRRHKLAFLITFLRGRVFCFVCFIGPSGGASRWRVCYQRGLPRIISILFNLWILYFFILWSIYNIVFKFIFSLFYFLTFWLSGFLASNHFSILNFSIWNFLYFVFSYLFIFCTFSIF